MKDSGTQNKFFYALNKIHKAKYDQMKLSLQVKDMQEKYQKAQEAYTRVTEWKDIHQNSLEILPMYSDKKRIKDLLTLGFRDGDDQRY
jgi:hypothetical protein